MAMLEEHLASLLATPLNEALCVSWRAKAQGFLNQWPADRYAFAEPSLDDESCARALSAVRAAMSAVALSASKLPGYGPTHLERMLTWGVGLADNDGLSRPHAMRLFLAGAYSDLGRILVPRDTAALRHAEASAVIFDAVRDELGLPEAIIIPVRYAIVAHTVDRFDYDTGTYRVADDVRTIDKLDMLGGAGLVRCLAHYVLDEQIPFAPYGGSAQEPTVLWTWWQITENLYPIEASDYGRSYSRDAIMWAEDAMSEELTHPSPEHDIVSLLFDLINQVENLIPEKYYEQLDARMENLSADDYHRWGEILEETHARLDDEEHERTRARNLAKRKGDALLSGMAELLELGPGAAGTEVIRAEVARDRILNGNGTPRE